jgi:hypothetical protein
VSPYTVGDSARDLSDDIYAMMSLLRMRSEIIELDASSLFDAGNKVFCNGSLSSRQTIS